MQVRIVAFASARDALGAPELDFDVPPGCDVSQLGQQLVERFPVLGDHWPQLAVAVDGELVDGEHVLETGCEVALLPPVSGGDHPPRVRFTDERIDVETLLAAVEDPRHGATVLFVGRVRNHRDEAPVTRLHYQAYEAMAVPRVEAILKGAEEQWGPLHAAVVHRLGIVDVGGASIAIAVSSPHRVAAYEASRYLLERIKREVPIWKCEEYADGQRRWREEESLGDSSSIDRPAAKPEPAR